eukprot:TRINITY_DN110272_c0_g1_i1.p1 TRINITY_DN110272_c0_g1~~TRINITY_DN110272_c0_g1_i1.p1  ORF type:complete len:119 (+),score=30.42 TRINITY_DN110272_c0_g1_i1:249-605(+)
MGHFSFTIRNGGILADATAEGRSSWWLVRFSEEIYKVSEYLSERMECEYNEQQDRMEMEEMEMEMEALIEAQERHRSATELSDQVEFEEEVHKFEQEEQRLLEYVDWLQGQAGSGAET